MKHYDVLVYGPIFCDLIFTGLLSLPILGEELYAENLTVSLGGSAIVAAGLQRLGAKVGLIADLGNDPFSTLVWHSLEEKGLDRALIQRHPYSLKQVTVAFSYPKDRAFVTRFEQPEVTIDLARIINKYSASHLHICSFLAAMNNPNAANVAHTAGLTTSADLGWAELSLSDPKIESLISELDVFLPSRSELLQLTNLKNRDKAAIRILSIMKQGILVVKEGANGATAYSRKVEEMINVEALPIEPVDTTGAGDAFDAGFIFGYINNKPLRSCLQYGVVCGGLTTTLPGGTQGFQTLEEVEHWLQKLQS